MCLKERETGVIMSMQVAELMTINTHHPKKKKAVLKRGQEKSPSSVEWVKTSVRCDL